MAEPQLTAQQRSAVEDRGGALLVSAAAGSGKTKVLVERLFRYVTEERRNVDDFLIITYTRAAAAELRGKIAAELSRRMGENPGDQHLRRQLLRVYQADIKTVDAFCTALLRENTHLLAQEGDRHALTPDFRVLDDGEAELLRQRVLNRVLEEFYKDLTPGGEELADTLGAGRDDAALASLVQTLYNKLQSHADPDGWLLESRKSWEDLPGDFDGTGYARVLLEMIRRQGAHWANQLRRGAARTQGDSGLEKGYGGPFLISAGGFDALAGAAGWEDARRMAAAVEFPRLVTPRGRKEDPLIAGLKPLREGAKDALKKLGKWLDISGEEALEDLRAVAPAMTALLDLTAAFSRACRAEKLRINAADFSDQEHLALRLLVREDGTPTELGEQVAARYTEILVDEYQDTNEIQNAIFRAVSKDGKNLFTVGDVKQSIYRFRLADPSIFLEKYERFRPREEAEDGEERKVLLTKNFRSRQEILDAANFVFENILSVEMGDMEYGEDAALHFGAEYYPPRKDCQTEFHLIKAHQRSAERQGPVKKMTAEARFVARRIRQLLDEGYPVTGDGNVLRPCVPEDIVILMRSPGSRTEMFAAALAEQEIPCSFQENEDFFHSMEVSTVVSLLELIDNPRQDVPLIAVLRSPIFGFTPDRLSIIRGKSAGDFYEAVEADGGGDCAAFLETLKGFREAAGDMSVQRLLWHIYNRLNLLGLFGAMDRGLERRENLIALARQAGAFESGGCRGLFAFVTRLRQLLEAGKAPTAASGAAVNGVRLMSIHKSKGLEFPIVILADLDNRFSRQDFNTPVLVHPSMGLGPRRVDLERKIRYATLARAAIEETQRRENLAEEQRVLYVAMTRPKEKLILVCSMHFAETRLQRLAASAACPVPPESVAACGTYGEWLLLPLLCRTEAEPLRALAGVECGDTYGGGTAPWEIFLHDGEDFREEPIQALPAGEEDRTEAPFDPALLAFAYPYQRETVLPAKLTATQLKGRLLDQEIAENAAHTPYIRPLSQPKFRREEKGLTPAERGTAMHLALQHLDFAGGDAAAQLETMVQKGFIAPEQAAAVETSSLNRLLASPLGEELRTGRNLLREYPFTLLVDAREYEPEASGGDSILLQGVVDCCFETDEGLTVVDFKTDRVKSDEELRQRSEHYRPQLEAYSLALERVLEKKVVRRVLYFLTRGTVVEL